MPCNDAPLGLLLSGGLDSSILLGHLVRAGRRVQPIYVRCDVVWQDVEFAAARRFVTAINDSNVAPLVELEMPVGDLYGDHWSMTGKAVPDEVSPDEAVYLLGRNPLLLMKPALWCNQQSIHELALATLADNPFADASAEFFRSFEQMLAEATHRHIKIVRPFERYDKTEVIHLGAGLPLQHTFSCLSPVGDQHCGRCNKCAERSIAFRQLGMRDPTDYARVPRSWPSGGGDSTTGVRIAASHQ